MLYRISSDEEVVEILNYMGENYKTVLYMFIDSKKYGLRIESIVACTNKNSI